MSTTAKFITLEGIEGVGKTTAITTVANFLKQQGIAHIQTREPGGTDIAEAIRMILLSQHEEPMSQLTELLLMFAARRQHVDNVILPALANQQWVICDRFTDATFAYQGDGRGVDSNIIQQLADAVHPNLQPDLTLLLDAPVDLALARAKARSEADRFEAETVDFFTRVRNMYLQRAEHEPNRFRIIDASQPLDMVTDEIQQCLQQWIVA